MTTGEKVTMNAYIKGTHLFTLQIGSKKVVSMHTIIKVTETLVRQKRKFSTMILTSKQPIAAE
jgi:hypothetical protein